MKPSNIPEDLVLVKRNDAHRQLNISRMTGWKLERENPDFPKPIQTGPRTFCYRLSELRRYIETRPIAIDPPRR